MGTPSPTLLLTKCATPAQLRSALPSPSRSPSRSLLRSAPRSPVRSAPPSPTRSQGLPVLRSLLLLRPQLPTLPLLLLPPLWPLLVTEPALVPVLVPVLATVLVSLAFTKHSANVLFLLLSMICYLMNKD